MEPEETTPSSKKKFLKIALIVLTVLLVLMSGAFFLTKMKNAKQSEVQTVVFAQKQKVYTQVEKLQILENLAQVAQKDTATQEEKLRTLQSLAKKAPKDTHSIEEKMRLLQVLVSKSNQ